MDLPVGGCFDCLKGSFVKKDPNVAFGRCMSCGKVTDCIRGDSIELFIPYIPLQIGVFPDPPPTDHQRIER